LNETEFSAYFYFPEYWDKLARYTKNSEIRFHKMSFPFALHPEFTELLAEWKAPLLYNACSEDILVQRSLGY